jgi:hypothetical protein
MSASAQYAVTPRFARAVLTAGDASRTLPTLAQTVFTAGASGSRIDRVVVEAAGTTTASQVRLWEHDGTNYTLIKELALASATPSSTVQGTTMVVNTLSNPELFPLILPTGHSLRATLADTQVTQGRQVDSIAAYGTLNGVVTLGNSKFTVTAVSTVAVSASVTQGAAAALTLTATPYVPVVPSVLTMASTGNISGTNFTIAGTDASGVTVTEVLAGPNNNTVYSTKVYASVTSIHCSAAVGTATGVGIASSVTMPVTPTPITITSVANISAVSFTIRGTDQTGATITEVLVGGVAAATVTSVNTYKSVNYLSAGSSAATTSVGTPAVLTQVNVVANGGDF